MKDIWEIMHFKFSEDHCHLGTAKGSSPFSRMCFSQSEQTNLKWLPPPFHYIHSSGHLKKGIAYFSFQSNILLCFFADLLNVLSQISPVELWLLFYSHQTPWQSWAWVTMTWEILEFSFSLTDCVVPTANCRHWGWCYPCPYCHEFSE